MKNSLNSFIDHTLLKPDASQDNIKKLCEEAKQYHFACVYVNPTWVEYACGLLKDTPVNLGSVAGFPLGASTSESKASEAHQLVHLGANEIDMVLNIGALKSKKYDQVKSDVQSVVKAAQPAIVKVIIETCLLNDDEKKIACLLCVEAGAQYVKTSTGFSSGGATLHDVQLMRSVVGPDFGIKASGGISDQAFALELIQAGATRIGTSKGVAIVAS
jgi:deoxyribose-phosphate aldolase